MANLNNYRRASAVLRNGLYDVPVSADDFLSIALPEGYTLDGSVGDSAQPISVSSDNSAVVTLTCGAFSEGHVVMGLAWTEQETVRESNAPSGVIAEHRFVTPNGDTITGRGVIDRPGTIAGGTTAGTRAWTVKLSTFTFEPAVALVPGVVPA